MRELGGFVFFVALCVLAWLGASSARECPYHNRVYFYVDAGVVGVSGYRCAP